MHPQAGHNVKNNENVINIVVIKDPGGWNGTSADEFQLLQEPCEGRVQRMNHVLKRTNGASAHAPLYKSQSFTVGVPPSSTSASRQQLVQNASFVNKLNTTTAITSSTNISYNSSPANQTISSFSNPRTPCRKLTVEDVYPNYTQLQQKVNIHNVMPNVTNRNFQTGVADVSIKKKLVRHRSVTFPLEGNLDFPPETPMYNCFNNVSTNSNQPYTPYLGSPAIFKWEDSQEMFNSSVATTPDSGFCTPSLLSAPFKSLLSSTPTVSSSKCPDVDLGDVEHCSPVPGEKSGDSLFDNSIDWREIDIGNDNVDSAVDDDGPSSLDSSLRSVNWLKTFPIGDCVIPLNISPPMPSSSQPCQTPHGNQSSQAGTQLPCFDQIQVKETNSSIPRKMQVKANPTHQPSPLLLPTMPTPFPVFMSNPMPPIYATSQDAAMVQPHASQPALGEITGIKKGKKPPKRTKNKGHLFPRPSHSYTDLIKLALKSSENSQLTLREIIAWIEEHFPFFKHEAKHNWQSYIKQSLSQHADFVKVDGKEPGFIGRKWTLGSSAYHQHLKPVLKPPEIPSHVMASLNKSKRNAPQPILPKISAYALVPIQNLALDTASQSNNINTVHVAPKGLQLSQPMQQQQQQHQQKLIHILPNPQQHHSHLNPAIPTARQIPAAETKSRHLPRKVTKSSDLEAQFRESGREHSRKRASDAHSDQPDISGKLPIKKWAKPGRSQAKTETKILQQNARQLSELQKQGDFPLDSVVDITEDKASCLGENKIIFMVKDKEKHLSNFNPDIHNPSAHSAIKIISAKSLSQVAASSTYTQVPMKRGLAKALSVECRMDPDKKMGPGKKFGPVMNLRQMLQDCHEDKVAADTIGRLLVEEDNKKYVCENNAFKPAASPGNFTLLKPDTFQRDVHSNRLSTLSGQGLHHGNNTSQTNEERTNVHYGNSMPATSKKTGIIRRLNIIKSHPLTTKSYTGTNVNSDNTSMSWNKTISSASQLAFPDTVTEVKSIASYSDSSSKSALSNSFPRGIPKVHSCTANANSSVLPCPVFYRSKSRRKQIHVPLTSEISPNRNLDGFEDNQILNPPKIQIISSSDQGGPLISSFTNISAFAANKSENLQTFLFSPARSMKPDEHLPSDNDNLSSLSDIENPPSLHFLSTFSKMPDSSNKENEALPVLCSDGSCQPLQLGNDVPSTSQLANDSSSKLSHFVKPANDHLPVSDANSSHSSHLSHPFHSPVMPSANLPATMCTPPCGTRLHPSSVSPSTSTTNNSVASSAYQSFPTANHSPPFCVGMLQQLHPLDPLTPPSVMAPLSMSTPTHPPFSSNSNICVAGDVLDMSPLPGNGTNILDFIPLDQLDILMADLHAQQSFPARGFMPSTSDDSQRH